MATTLASGTPPPAKETMNGSSGGIGAAKPHAYEILIIVIFHSAGTRSKQK